MKFSMFFIAEYSNMLTASALMATLFLGGWDIPARWDNMRVDRAGHRRRRGSRRGGRRCSRSARSRVKTLFFVFLLHVGALDRAALPLRPGHASRLEGHAADRRSRYIMLIGDDDPRAGLDGHAVRLRVRPRADGGEHACACSIFLLAAWTATASWRARRRAASASHGQRMPAVGEVEHRCRASRSYEPQSKRAPGASNGDRCEDSAPAGENTSICAPPEGHGAHVQAHGRTRRR